MTRAKFASALAREPEHIRKAGRAIVKNLAIIESDKSCDEDKAAAKVQLPKSLALFEKARKAQ